MGIGQLCQEIVTGLLTQLPSELATIGVVALVTFLGRAWKRHRGFNHSEASSTDEGREQE